MNKISVLSAFIFRWEGGFSDHPADRGGATNMGVTLRTWQSQGYDKDGDGDIDVADLRLVTRDDATRFVLYPLFCRIGGDKIDDPAVAAAITDWAWCSGAGIVKRVQRLVGATPDGIVGADTLRAINAQDGRTLFGDINAMRRKFLRGIVASRPSQRVFLKGWLNRVNAMSYEKFL